MPVNDEWDWYPLVVFLSGNVVGLLVGMVLGFAVSAILLRRAMLGTREYIRQHTGRVEVLVEGIIRHPQPIPGQLKPPGKRQSMWG